MNMNNTIQATALMVQAGVPLLLMGPPGVGKTAINTVVANQLGRRLFTFIGSIHEPQDINGFPFADTDSGYSRMLLPEWVGELEKADKEGIKTTFFGDEITTCPASMQAAMLRPVNEGHIGNYKLPDSLSFVFAANPPEIAAGGHSLTPPMANRMCHIKVTLDTDQWVEGIVNGFRSPSVPTLPDNWRTFRIQTNALVSSYIKRQPTSLLLAADKFQDDNVTSGAWPSPRTWEMVSEVLAACEAARMPVDIANELVCGCVGEGEGLKFLAWRKALDLPDPEWILQNPHKAKPMARADQTFALANSLVSVVLANNTIPRWRAALIALSVIAGKTPDAVFRSVHQLVEDENRPKDLPEDWTIPKECGVFKELLKELKIVGI